MATESTALLSEKPSKINSAENPYDDAPEHMTWERRVARRLYKYSFYNPQYKARAEYEKTLANADEEETKTDKEKSEEVVPPSLDTAWAYFEHIVLPRHLLSKEGKDMMQRAEPGRSDVPTRLYPVWKTPETELADFGIGVGIYFYMLRVLAIIMLIAGFINIPSYTYFLSDKFSPDDESSLYSLSMFLIGSATCTNAVWEACPSCTKEQWEAYPSTLESFATTHVDGDSEPLTFIKVNECKIGLSDGIGSLVCLIFVCVSVWLMSVWSSKKEVELDEAEQSASDYSIAVENPPLDARDPEEWKAFFEQNFEGCQVACCTIALDNEELVRALCERREYLLQLEMLMPGNVEFNKNDLQKMVEVALPLPLYMRLQMYYDAEGLYKCIVELDKKIDELSKYKHDCSDVFISFETEKTQREVLEAFSISRWNRMTNNKKALPKNLLFRGEHILNIVEPAEPSSIRWQDLDESFKTKMIQQIITFILTVITIGIGGYLIFLARKYSPFLAAMTISFLGTMTPYVIYYINDIETHRDEGSRAASQFTKMAFVRWIYTAIITSLVTPFVYTLEEGGNYLIYSVFYIFFTELLTPPLMQLMDTGTFYRHTFGPREPTLKRMCMCFQGTPYELSERYTDMTKIVFFTFFYAVIYPAGFFWAAAILTAKYWFDKYSLLRTWSPAPIMGSQIAVFSRKYFFSLAIAIYAINAAYTYASFPYDNACPSSTQVSEDYVGTHVAYTYDDYNEKEVEINISISPDNENYLYCYQNMMWFLPIRFPPMPKYQPEGKEWMGHEQEIDVYLFGFTSLVITILVAYIFFQNLVLGPFVSCFMKTYKPEGEPSEIKFSEVRVMPGYVPQVKVEGYNFPLLACDVNNIKDQGLIGWEDPTHSFDHHNLVCDVPRFAKQKADGAGPEGEVELTGVSERKLLMEKEDEVNPFMFSIVKDWTQKQSKE